jgi:hypothetical protein
MTIRGGVDRNALWAPRWDADLKNGATPRSFATPTST